MQGAEREAAVSHRPRVDESQCTAHAEQLLDAFEWAQGHRQKNRAASQKQMSRLLIVMNFSQVGNEHFSIF
jgi:hypothetical protein